MSEGRDHKNAFIRFGEEHSGQPETMEPGWLARYILPHESALRSWLRCTGLGRGFEQDVVQEAYCLLLSHPNPSTIQNGRAYFFAVARTVVLRRLRREKVVQIDAVARIEHLNLADAAPDATDIISDRQQLELARQLIAELPARCRQVLILRKLEGLTQRETAARLKVSENVVEKQLARGLELLIKSMAERGFERGPSAKRRRWLRSRP